MAFIVRVIFLFCFILISANAIEFKIYQKDSLNFSNTEYLMSEKLDGIRGVWNGTSLLTRNNNEIKAPKEWTKNFPPFMLDGELWIKRNSFEQVSSIVRNSKSSMDDWREVTYNVFDAPNICDSCTLLERLDLLTKYLQENPNENIRIIPQHIIASEDELGAYFDNIVKNGGEGLIIRENKNPNIAYKYKPYYDNECQVIGYKEGKGKYEGLVGAIICKTIIKDTEIILSIGSGLSKKDRANPPKINSIITYKYNGLTKNNVPRFPVFIRERVE